MLNPDGVAEGNYRRDLNGADLNRSWKNPSKAETPSIYHCRKWLESLTDTTSVVFIDVHAHSASLSNFFISNSTTDSQYKDTRSEEFLRLMQKRLAGFAFKQAAVDTDEKKAGCARRAIGEALSNVYAYTLELSLFAKRSKSSTVNKAMKKTKPSNAERAQKIDKTYVNSKQWYMDIGREFGRGFEHVSF